MNVLFIHEVDWLNKVVFDIHTLAEALSLRGHRVYAIDYENNWKPHGFFDLGTLKTHEFNDVSRAFPGSKVSVIRPGNIKISGLSRFSAAFTHYREIRRTIKRRNIDVIVLYSVPTNGLQAISAAKKYHIPLVFRSIDILNQLVSYPHLRPATRILEKMVYPRADMILTLTPTLSRYVRKFGAREEKVKELLMPVDTSIFYPFPPPEELRSQWGIGSEDRVILFIGTLFNFSGLDMVIPRFSEIIKENPNARLLIVGDGPQRAKLESIIKGAGLEDRVTITGFQPYKTMPRYIALADVCLNSFLINGTTRDIFPGKIVQYLACAKPVVATPLAGLRAITPGEEQGMVFATTPGEMVEKLVTLLKDKEYRERLGRNGLDYVKSRHSYESIAAQLEVRLQEAIDEKCVKTT